MECTGSVTRDTCFPTVLIFHWHIIMAPSFSKTARKRTLSDSDVREINRKRVKKMGVDDATSMSIDMMPDDTVAQQTQNMSVS